MPQQKTVLVIMGAEKAEELESSGVGAAMAQRENDFLPGAGAASSIRACSSSVDVPNGIAATTAASQPCSQFAT
jgi:hypothetical protein